MSIKILAIDSSTIACSAALLIDNNIEEKFQIAPRQHAQLLLPMIKELLADAQISLKDLNAIAFGKGPGSFTGLRIAAGITQGLAFGANLPVVAISTLQALAEQIYQTDGANKVITAIDARMQQIYWATYQIDDTNTMQATIADTLCSPSEAPLPAENNWIGVGDAWQQYQNELTALIGTQLQNIIPERYPHASSIAKLAQQEYIKDNTIQPHEAIPIYLRDKSAWKKS